LDENVAATLKDLGYKIITWNIDPRDWEISNSDQVFNTVTSAIDSTSRSASYNILFHDIHSSTVEAQDRIIKWLKSKGFRFVTMDQCI
jgi:peptidoglycan/xylan/chitin deacetylase (PgdA/CDA1 family)